MYVPDKFSFENQAQVFDFIEEIRLGSLVSTTLDPHSKTAFHASHIPFMVDRDRGKKGVLIGHVARANPQWQALQDGGNVLALFMGPSAYISPSWYQTSPRAPTWTYVSVQVQGTVRLITQLDALKSMVLRLCNESEPPSTGWAARDLPDSFVDRLIKGIIGFEIEIDVLEGALRLGQNNNMEDRKGVAEALAQGTGQQPIVASLMQSIIEQETADS